MAEQNHWRFPGFDLWLALTGPHRSDHLQLSSTHPRTFLQSSANLVRIAKQLVMYSTQSYTQHRLLTDNFTCIRLPLVAHVS